MLRSVLAILAGLVVLTVASFAIEAAVHGSLLRLFPKTFPDAAALTNNIPVRLLMTVYTLLSVAAGGYVAAWLAGRAPLKHAVIVGVLELLMTIAAMFQFLATTPLWGWIVGTPLIVPAAWWGGRVRSRTLKA